MADVSVDATISTATARGMRSVVFTTDQIGYVFYVDSDGTFGYTKSTDGGATWGAQVELNAATTNVAFDVWFDQWTPGDSGTLIHIWNFDVTNDAIRYRTLNTTGDVLSSTTNIVVLASAVAGRGAFVSGTKARSGFLYCAYDIDAGAERGFVRGSPAWANVAPNLVEATLDTCKLFPASGTGDNNDCWALYYDVSALALTLKLWDNSAFAEVESSTIGVAHTDGATDLTGQFGYDAAVRHSDGHLIVAALSGRDVAASTHQVFDITDTSTITTKTAIEASTDDHYYPQVCIDQSTNAIYVAYVGKRDGTEVLDTTVKVYYTKSTDGGATWTAGDTAYMEGAAGVVLQVWTPKSGLRFYAVWRVGTTLLGNAVNSVSLPTGPAAQGVTGVTLASGAQRFAPTVTVGAVTVTGSTRIAGSSVTAPTVIIDQAITGATVINGTVSVSDAFPYSDGALPTVSGGLYAKPSGWANPVAIASNLAKGTAAGENAVYRTGWTGSQTAQWAEITFDTVDSFSGATLFNDGVSSFYSCGAHLASNEVAIYRCVAGVFGGALTVVAWTNPVPGDVMRLDVWVDGPITRIRVRRNGVVAVAYADSDASRLTAGVPGFRIWDTALRVSRFAAGDVGPALFAPTVAAGSTDQAVTGTTITVGSAVTAPTVSPQAVTVTGSTVASGVLVRVPTVTVGAVTVIGGTVGTTAQRFAASVTVGAVTVVAATRPTTAQVFTATVAAGAVTVTGATVSSAVQVRQPSVVPGAVTVTGATVTGTAAVFAPGLTLGAVTVVGATVASGIQVRVPTVAVGSVAVLGGFISSTTALYAVTVIGAGGIAGSSIGSTAQLYAATVTRGAVTVIGGTVARTVQVHPPTIMPGVVTISGATRGSTAAAYAATITVPITAADVPFIWLV